MQNNFPEMGQNGDMKKNVAVVFIMLYHDKKTKIKSTEKLAFYIPH